MLTQNKKTLCFRALSIFALLVSMVCNAFVFERFIAAILKLYKFDFAWPSPIYLNRSTVILFFLMMVCFTVVTYLLTKLSSKLDSKITRRFRMSSILNIFAVGVLMLMLTTRLAVLNM